MRKKSFVFVMFAMFLSVLILSNGQSAYANESDYEWDDNMDGAGNPDGTVTIIKYKGANKDVIIPDKLDDKAVTSIGFYAFENNNLTSVTLPASLTSIWFGAFSGNNLTSVTLPDGLTSIGSQAFSYNNLESVILPASLTSIESQAFSYNNLESVTLPASLTSIGGSAFSRNPLMDVTLTSNISSMPASALSFPWKAGHVFDGWYTDSAFTIEWDKVAADVTLYAKWLVSDYERTGNPDGTVTITGYTGTSKDVVIPDTLGGKTVTSIGLGAFSENNLTSVILPASLTSIGSQAFEDNDLTSVILPASLTSIGSQAFYRNNLESVILPASLTSIGDWAFSGNNLISVTLPEGLASIGLGAFQDNDLTSVILPASLTSIGSQAFYRNNLESVILPASLTSIGSQAFSYNNLESVTLPASLTSIGDWAFLRNPLMDVTLTPNISSMPDSALSFPWKAGHVFAGWYTDSAFAIEWDKVAADVTLYAKWLVSDYERTDNPDGTVTITGYTGTSKDVVIPDELDDKVVTSIGSSAFSGNNLESVILPASLTSIGDWAFYNNNLTSVTLPEGLASIGLDAFRDNDLTSVILPASLTSIGGSAFSRNPLMDVTLTSNISSMPASALSFPWKAGHVFAGWYTDSAFTIEWDKVPADVTLYAKWLVNEYNVTFDSQGGSTVDSDKADYATLINTPTEPTKLGYTFADWYTDATFTTPWNFEVDTVQGNMTLYAKWQHKVTFDSTGGSAVADALVDSNVLLIPPSIPTKSGYTFVDWYTDPAFTIPWDFTKDAVQGNMTLYAKWTVNGHTITFDSQGGSSVPDVVADSATKISAPTPPTKSGHTFAGWYMDAALTTPWNFTTDTVQGDMTLYAKWKVKPRPMPPPLDIQATMTTDEALTEDQLDGSTITVNVSDTNFMVSLAPEHFELQNVPTGLTIREVKRISSWQVELTLAFDGTHLAQDHDLGLMIHGAALTNGSNVTVNGTLQIQKNEIPYKIITKEGTFEPTKVWTVKLSNEVDAKTVQDALYIVDAEGNRILSTFTSEGRNIFIQPPTENYADGTYTLYITSKLKNKNGTDLKEPIQMIFTIEAIEEPEQEETYKTIIEEGTFPSDQVWTIDLLMDIDSTTLENGVFMEDENGTIVPVTCTSDGTNLVVQAPVEGYDTGTYRLYITSEVKDTNGMNLKEPIQMIFTVEVEDE